MGESCGLKVIVWKQRYDPNFWPHTGIQRRQPDSEACRLRSIPIFTGIKLGTKHAKGPPMPLQPHSYRAQILPNAQAMTFVESQQALTGTTKLKQGGEVIYIEKTKERFRDLAPRVIESCLKSAVGERMGLNPMRVFMLHKREIEPQVQRYFASGRPAHTF